MYLDYVCIVPGVWCKLMALSRGLRDRAEDMVHVNAAISSL